MKWQFYGADVPKGMGASLAAASLEQLYQMQSEAEARLAELRASEPSTKRKNTRRYTIWFAACQDEIEQLKRIRDAIIDARARLGE